MGDDSEPAGAQDIQQWRPTKQIAYAWRVVERITVPTNGLINPLTGFPAATHFGRWFDHAALWSETADGAAMQICLAALHSIGIDNPTLTS